MALIQSVTSAGLSQQLVIDSRDCGRLLKIYQQCVSKKSLKDPEIQDVYKTLRVSCKQRLHFLVYKLSTTPANIKAKDRHWGSNHVFDSHQTLQRVIHTLACEAFASLKQEDQWAIEGNFYRHAKPDTSDPFWGKNHVKDPDKVEFLLPSLAEQLSSEVTDDTLVSAKPEVEPEDDELFEELKEAQPQSAFDLTLPPSPRSITILRLDPAFNTVTTRDPKALQRKIAKIVSTSFSPELQIPVSRKLTASLNSRSISRVFISEPQPLDNARFKSYLRFLYAAIASFKADETWVRPFGYRIVPVKTAFNDVDNLPPEIQQKETCFFEPVDGLKAMVFLGAEKEAVVAFGSQYSGDAEIDDVAERGNLSARQGAMLKDQLENASKPVIFARADRLFQTIRDHNLFRNREVFLVGQCLGGLLAEYTALRHGVKAVCFNTYAMGSGLQEALGRRALQSAEALVTHISTKTDFHSDFPRIRMQRGNGTVMDTEAPDNLGVRFTFPTAYPQNRIDTHTYIGGSAAAYLGYTTRTPPAEMNEIDLIKSS